MYDRHRQTAEQTDRRTNIMAIARRFVLTNASHANNNSNLLRIKPCVSEEQNAARCRHQTAQLL